MITIRPAAATGTAPAGPWHWTPSGRWDEPAHHVQLFLPVRHPFFDHAGNGQNTRLDRLKPVSGNVDAALNKQREETLQAGQERDKRRGIGLFRDILKTCDELD